MEFSADFFAGNRRKLLAEAKSNLIVLTANGLLQSSAGLTFPFKQDNNFWYLSGIEEPDVVLVLHGRQEFLIVPPRNKIRVIFEGAINRDELSRTSGIKEILDEKAGWQKLKQLLASSQNVGILMPGKSYYRDSGMYVNPARARLVKRLKRVNPQTEFTDLREALANMRMVKQLVEIKAIQAAIDITTQTFRQVFSRRHEFTYEYQIEAAMNGGFRFAGGSGPAFPTIAAGGKNAGTLHYTSNNSPLNPSHLVLIDAGAEVNHYNADLTRTIALKTASRRQQQLFDAVLAIQKFAIAQLKPGVLLKDYAQAVEQYAGRQFQEVGLLKRANDKKSIRRYWPHSVSHFLGLDVHDAGDYRRPLEPNMVLTVEPGVYVPEESIGIRIEDNVLITPTGVRVLSHGLPRQL